MEQVLGLAQIDDIEDDSLVLVNILNGEIEPQSVSWITGIRSDIQIIFKLVDEVHSAKVPRLEYRVKTKMTFLSFARVSGGSHHNLLHITQSTLVVAVIGI